MLKTELDIYTTFADKHQTERDYLQDLLLYGVYANPYLTGALVFKGGTALSKFYNSGRFSEDLDFTSTSVDHSTDKIIENIEHITSAFMYSSALAEKSVNKFGTVSISLVIRGPRYNGKRSTIQNVAFEINTSAKLRRKPVSMVKKPIYRDAPGYTALIMDGGEIFAEKIRAIMSKRRKHRERDLYDIYFLFGKGMRLDEELAKEKLSESEMAFSEEILMGAIEGVEATWNELGPFLSQKLMPFKDVKEDVVNGLKAAGML